MGIMSYREYIIKEAAMGLSRDSRRKSDLHHIYSDNGPDLEDAYLVPILSLHLLVQNCTGIKHQISMGIRCQFRLWYSALSKYAIYWCGVPGARKARE